MRPKLWQAIKRKKRAHGIYTNSPIKRKEKIKRRGTLLKKSKNICCKDDRKEGEDKEERKVRLVPKRS